MADSDYKRNCFENFNGKTYDVSRLSPVQALGKLSADAMMISDRVGRASEDATMVQARPYLSRINSRGLVTTDSQMGKNVVTQTLDARHERVKQRSYVTGIIPRHLGKEFLRRMKHEDNVVVRVDLPKTTSWIPMADFVYFFPVTVYGDDDFQTSVPMVPDEFEDMEFLPEIQTIMNDVNCKRIVEQDALIVQIVDAVWGRPFWLFEKIVQVLDMTIESRNT